MKKKGLTEEEANGASRTRTVLGGLDGQTAVIYYPEKRYASVVRAPEGIKGSSEVPFEFGWVDESKITPARVHIDELMLEGQLCKRISRQHQGGSSTFVIDPVAKDRFRKRSLADEKGKTLSEELAGDYRQVDGYWIPFHFEERAYSRETGEMRSLKIVKVVKADLRTALPDNAFSLRLEKATTVNDGFGKAVYMLGEPVDVSLRSVETLRKRVKPLRESQ